MSITFFKKFYQVLLSLAYVFNTRPRARPVGVVVGRLTWDYLITCWFHSQQFLEKNLIFSFRGFSPRPSRTNISYHGFDTKSVHFVSFLKKLKKLKIERSFDVLLNLVYGHTHAHAHTHGHARVQACTRTHVYHRAGRVINLVRGGSGHKTDTTRTFVQNSTNSNTEKNVSVISCRIVSKKLNSTIADFLIYYTRQP